jgi:hypothetical protein
MNFYNCSPFGGDDLFRIYNNLCSISPHFVSTILQHERPEQELVARFIPANSVVLELGGNYGATSVIINSKLYDKTKHIIIEPEQSGIDSLLRHKDLFNLKYTPIHGILAKNKEKQVELWPACINSKVYQLSDLENIINGSKFTAIMADCEGAFDPILQDFPELLDTVQVIVLENDGGDIKRVRHTLENANFIVVHSQLHPYYNGVIENFNKAFIGFHEVWVKI